MAFRIKLLFAKLTILLALLSLGGAVYYFSHEYPLSKSFHLGVLVGLGVLLGAAMLFFALSLLFGSTTNGLESKREVPSFEEESYSLPKEERIIQHKSKEEFMANNVNERKSAYEARQKLEEMKREQGAVAEVLLILPYDLSFLLAKESIESLFYGKIQEKNQETGIILGSAGIGPTPQKIKMTIQAVTPHSTSIRIISKSSAEQQSERKNSSYIKKISKFLRKKESFYIN